MWFMQVIWTKLYELFNLHELCMLCKWYELCRLYELCKLYEYFVNHLKSLEIARIALNIFKKRYFLLIYKMQNSNYKNKNIETKYWNTWYDWLINYIPEPTKNECGLKDKVLSLFKTNKPKQTVYWRGKKLIKSKTKKKRSEVK